MIRRIKEKHGETDHDHLGKDEFFYMKILGIDQGLHSEKAGVKREKSQKIIDESETADAPGPFRFHESVPAVADGLDAGGDRVIRIFDGVSGSERVIAGGEVNGNIEIARTIIPIKVDGSRIINQGRI